MFDQEDLAQLTYKINGAIFEVNKVLGAGFLEKMYENALVLELKRQGLKAESQVPIMVSYKGDIVGDYIADIMVEYKVILELKAVEKIQKVHEAQIINYLKATGIKIGLLVNFKHPKEEIGRYVFRCPKGPGDKGAGRSPAPCPVLSVASRVLKVNSH